MTLPRLAGRGRGGARRHARRRARRGRHRPHGRRQLGQLRPAALVGLGRISEIRGWQYQDGHALLGAGLTHARMGRPDFAALIPALAAAARAAGPAADPQRGHPRRQHRHGRPDRRRAARARRPGGRPRHRGPGRRPPRDPGVAPAGGHGDAAARRTHRLRARAAAARAAGLPEGHRPHRPGPRDRLRRASSSTRRGAECAARSAP